MSFGMPSSGSSSSGSPSAGSPLDDKELVRQATDLVDLVGSHIPLERRGRLFLGLCPWHDDSRPSLQVNAERQFWKCWVCNVGGDCFNFVMQREGVDFPEALRMLADRAGITLRRRSSIRSEAHEEKANLYQALSWAQHQFQQWLLEDPAAKVARDYLAERGMAADAIRRFGIGASPTNWQWLIDRARSTPHSDRVLEACGLILPSRRGGWYDRFRGRVLFPIRDEQQRTVAFGGRVLPGSAREDEPKYVNSPETRVFSKHRQLYALDLARDAIRKERLAVVVEGYTDAILAHQYGLHNVVAVLGTALGAGHVRILKRYADAVCLLLDGDEAGQRRTNEVLDLFIAEQLDLRVATLPEGEDPADLLHRSGAAALREVIASAPDALEHKLRVVTDGIDLLRDTHRANAALEQMLATLAQAPRGGSAFSRQLRQQQMITRLAHQFHVEESVLRRRLDELRTGRSGGRAAGHEPVSAEGRRLPPLTLIERELIELLIAGGDFSRQVAELMTPDQVEHPAAQQLLMAAKELVAEGRHPDAEQLMLRVEDPQLSYLLAEVAEGADAKAERTDVDYEQRLRDLVERLEERRAADESRRVIADLESRRYHEEEELDALRAMIERQRARQGISAPTDG